jgi:lysophospholipase L1-like esterase
LPLKLALLVISLILGGVLAEAGLRVFYGNSLALVENERSLTYRHDPVLGWFPTPNSIKKVKGTRTFTATHNSKGFRDREPVSNNKPRIVFLGDSLVWGFDVEASERFTEVLQAKHPEWNVSNLGVSGYGTDQEYLLLQKYFDAYRPKVVVLVICGDNDNDDNASNFRGGYYKPYFTLEKGHLKLNGVPVPKSEKTFFAEHNALCRSYIVRLCARAHYRFHSPRPFRNNEPPTGALLLDMRSYVANKGAFFAVALQNWNPDLAAFLNRFNVPFVDLTTTNAADRYPAGNHWTPEGHKLVAAKIDEFLRKH